MHLFSVLIVLISLIFGHSVAENNNYIVELKFVLREERIPAMIGYLLTNSIELHDIQTEDIIRLSKLDQYDLDATIQLLNYFNITAEQAFTVDNLEHLLDDFDIEFLEFYRDLQTHLNLDDPTILEVVEELSIDKLKFFMAIVGQSYVYDILRDGNYDSEHVTAALLKAEKTENQVFTAVRDFMHKKVTAMAASDFMKVLENEYEWNRQSSQTLFKALNLTARDVYEVEKFRNIFKNISDGLNQNQTLGVFIAPDKVAVHELVYNLSVNTVDEISVQVQADGIEILPKKTQNIGERIVELDAKTKRSDYIEIVENYNSSENCFYVTLINGELRGSQVEIEENSFNKTSSLQFNVGSPLICDGFLYGLVREEDEQKITFDIFYTLDNPPPKETTNKANLVSSAFIILTFNLFITILS